MLGLQLIEQFALLNGYFIYIVRIVPPSACHNVWPSRPQCLDKGLH